MLEEDIQRRYYTATAESYDALHGHETPPLALAFLEAGIASLSAQTLLDVGSGTGAVLRRVSIKAIGIEPVAALREAGHARGIPKEALIDGDGASLPYDDGAFDVVCAFAVLHHVKEPHRIVAEMLRVARLGIFICDNNNFGQGRFRAVKRLIRAMGLWPVANFVKTRGRGYTMSEEDGLAYSYSVFNDYPAIRRACDVHVLNLDGDGRSAYRGSGAVALLGVKHHRASR